MNAPKAITALLAAVLLATPVFSQVLIRQVLPDPFGTDTGGEAVELMNYGNETINIGGWWLETPSSAKDATIPANTTLEAGAKYLLADAGWSALRDEPLWRDADHEEALTLANTNGSVTLHRTDGTISSTVHWDKAAAGKALLRTETGEYTEAEPDFFGPDSIEIPVEILPPLAIEVLDDDNASLPGIQLYPTPGRARNITVTLASEGPATLIFLNQSKTIKPGTATLSLPYTTPPGIYTIDAVKDSLHVTLNVTVLARTALGFSGNLKFRTPPGMASPAQTLIVRNIGNVLVGVGVAATPFKGPLALDGLIRHQGKPVGRNLTAVSQLDTGQDSRLNLTFEPPESATPGSYTSRLIVRAVTVT